MESLPSGKLLCVVSGGLDSVVLAYLAHLRGPVEMITFDYGQRHGTREIACAKLVSESLKIPWTLVDLRSIGTVLPSALTSPDKTVPHGHYAADVMKQTVVPNRNAIMLSVAVGIASAKGIGSIATAVHSGDHPIYPDCRPEFIQAMNSLSMISAEPSVRVLAPFVDISKTDIVRLGDGVGVPFAYTWSCYEGGLSHCGRCGTCVERKEAFELASISDPTIYQR